MITEEIQVCTRLKSLLSESVARNHSDNLLLSGGLDSSIVCSLLRPKKTVTIASSISAPDLNYARIIASKYSTHHKEFILTFDQILRVIDKVIHVLKTFDPIEVRNSSVVFAAIDHMREVGEKSLVTGDGGDELFAGYNYLLRYYEDRAKLDSELRRLWNIMSFSSVKIGRKLGVNVLTPFLDTRVMEFAKSLHVDTKLGSRYGKRWGKFILRNCFESELGRNVAWREKYAQEQGSGFATIRDFLLQQGRSTTLIHLGVNYRLGARIRDIEHLYYFRIYLKYFPPPFEEPCSGGRCPDCHGCLSDNSNYCHTCGCFPTNFI